MAAARTIAGALTLPAEILQWEVAQRKDSAGRTVRPAELPLWEFWTPNPTHPAVSWVIVADVDWPDGGLRALSCPSPPSWVVENTRNGHAQAGWVLSQPVSRGPRSRPKPQALLRLAAARLREAVGSDPCFTGARCRNPLFEGAAVRWGAGPRELDALLQPLELMALVERRPEPEPRQHWGSDSRPTFPEGAAPLLPGARNRGVFDAVRLRAWGTAAEAAEAANCRCKPPLGAAELGAIVRSVERWEREHGWEGDRAGVSEVWREFCAREGRKGGARNTRAQRAARAKGPAAASAVRAAEAAVRRAELRELARPVLAAGASRRAAARALGVAESSLRDALRG